MPNIKDKSTVEAREHTINRHLLFDSALDPVYNRVVELTLKTYPKYNKPIKG